MTSILAICIHGATGALFGLSAIFSICGQIEKQPGAQVIYANYYEQDKMLEHARRFADRGEIVVIGHSMGANSALDLANALNKEAIPIAALITFDPTVRIAIACVPSNVSIEHNFYQKFQALGRGQVTRCKKNKLTLAIENQLVTEWHSTMPMSERLQRTVLATIKAVRK